MTDLVKRLREDAGFRSDIDAQSMHLAADEIERLREELGKDRVCVSCGKHASVENITKDGDLIECRDKDGFSACTFDVTPSECWKIWRDRFYDQQTEIEQLRTNIKTLRQALLVISDGEGDAQVIATQTIGAAFL